MFRWLIFFVFAAFVTASLRPVPAQEDEQQQLEKLEREINAAKAREAELKKKAEAVARDAGTVTKKIIGLSSDIRETEQTLLAIENRLQDLANQVAAKQETIKTQSKNMGFTLAALQRMSQRPPEFILMRPAKAVETVRSADLLTAALPEIERKTEVLKADLEALEALKTKAGEEKSLLMASLSELKTQNGALETLQRERRALYADFLSGAEQEAEKGRRLAKEAKDLKGLIARLEAEAASRSKNALPSPPIPAGTSITKARGKIPFPASGPVTMRFGDKIPAGSAQGINIRTLSGGQVIAPFDGRIIYAGEFRNYGQLLIIAHGDGYHSLLAGLKRIDGLVGQWVLAGEPLGVMPETRLVSTESDSNPPGPELYFEIRRQGTPVDPLPWLKK